MPRAPNLDRASNVRNTICYGFREDGAIERRAELTIPTFAQRLHAARRLLPLALVPALLFGSMTIALRVPSIGRPQVTSPAPLDYSRGAVPQLAALRAPFIQQVLGGVLREPPPLHQFTESGSRSPIFPEVLNEIPPVVTHELINDDFRNAYVVQAGMGARTRSSEATREPGEPSDCAPVGERTVWYRFDPTVDIGLIADTFGTDHAVTLAVFQGKRLRDLSLVGCSTGARGNAHVPFSAVGGDRYYFQIASVSGGELSFNLHLQGVTNRVQWSHEFDAILFAASTDGRHWGFTGIRNQVEAPIASCFVPTPVVPLSPPPCSFQVYAADAKTGRTTLVSVTPSGQPANGFSIGGTLSAGGRYVTFASTASDVVEGDTNTCYLAQLPGSCWDVFVHDRDADGNGRFDERFPGAFKTVRVSVSSDGTQANDWSGLGFMSNDGRYVAWQSEASNLVDGDTNGVGDGFMHDRDADEDGIFDETHPGGRRTIRVTVASNGGEAEDLAVRSTDPRHAAERRDYLPFERGNHILGMSSNGRFAVFRSPASNLVPGDTNGVYDVFVRDIVANTTQRVNVSSRGVQADKGTRLHNGFARPISDDGRFVLFNSDATNLVPGDENESEDLFLRDLVAGTTTRLSVTRAGNEVREPPTPGIDVAWGGVTTLAAVLGFGAKIWTMSELNHAMSTDGRFVFFSSAGQLVPEDDDQHRDVYVRDLRRGTLSLVSVSTEGRKGNASSNVPHPSANGRVISFQSSATNLDQGEDAPAPGIVWTWYTRHLPRDR